MPGTHAVHTAAHPKAGPRDLQGPLEVAQWRSSLISLSSHPVITVWIRGFTALSLLLPRKLNGCGRDKSKQSRLL